MTRRIPLRFLLASLLATAAIETTVKLVPFVESGKRNFFRYCGKKETTLCLERAYKAPFGKSKAEFRRDSLARFCISEDALRLFLWPADSDETLH